MFHRHGAGRKMYIVSVFLVILLVFSAPVAAEDQPVLPVVGLQEVLQDVTETNPAILEALNAYKSVAAERSIATSEYLPTIGTQLSAGPEKTDGIPTNGEKKNLTATTATLFARQNLFNGGKTTSFVDETDARIKAAAYDVLDAANRVYLDTVEAYINVVRAKELLKIAEQNAYTQEQIMRQVREKTEAGFNRVSELYNSESRLALSKASFISRQQDLNQAMAKFLRQSGRLLEPEQFVEPALPFKVPATLGDTVEIAYHNHPALKVANYNIQTREYTSEKAAAAYWPTLDLELRGQYRDDAGGEEGQTTQAGAFVTFNYTFFDGGLRSGAKARDRQAVNKEKQRAYIERRNVNESVRLAWNIMEAEAVKKNYLIDHVMLSAKTLTAFKEEYYAGRRTLLDLLNMENEYTDAKLSRTESDFSYLISLYRIMQASGVLLDEYDTGLRELLGLPMDKEKDMAGYKNAASDRDKDQVDDELDQCDNSSPGIAADSFGCVKAYVNKVGYPREDQLNQAPYIAPKDSIGPVNYTTVKELAEQASNAQKHGVEPSIIRLEVQPNSDLVTDEAMRRLDALVKELQTRPKSALLVEGYIASDSKSEENTALSERRADLVKAYLAERGIDADRITVAGRGNENPLASNGTAAGRKMNRRIEVTITEKQ
jgi:outer membrane protein, adhesin transport system